MQSALCFTPATIRSAVSIKPSSSRVNSRRAVRLVVRATEETKVGPPVVEELKAPTPAPPATAPTTAEAASFSILGKQQEAINGRAAMLGLVIAAATELSTNQSVWSQIAGKYVDKELVEAPIGASTFAFFFVVVAMTFASFAPKVFKNEGPSDRSFGPFTPAAENLNGRLAMLGFSSLLIVELLKGNNPLF